LTVLAAASGETAADIRGSVDWERMEITAAVTVDLDGSGVRLPVERSRGEERLGAEYPRLIRPALLSLPVDSSGTLEDLITRGELPPPAFDDMIRSARRLPPALSPDLLSMSSRYTVNMRTIGAALIRHRRPAEAPRILSPVPAAAHTGIIIIADTELPVHGRNSLALPLPCFFPKIWDTDMNLIFERNMVESETARNNGVVRYVSEGSIFRPTPSGLEGELLDLAGPNPLRILARGVFGIRPTDPIIDREDALLILSSEENRRLLREGRVVFVLRADTLTTTISGGE
jgi:hypothetical protein